MGKTAKTKKVRTATPDVQPDIDFFRDAKLIEGILRKAVQEALMRHKKLGNPVAVWKDGEVVIIPPEEIPDFAKEPTRKARIRKNKK